MIAKALDGALNFVPGGIFAKGAVNYFAGKSNKPTSSERKGDGVDPGTSGVPPWLMRTAKVAGIGLVLGAGVAAVAVGGSALLPLAGNLVSGAFTSLASTIGSNIALGAGQLLGPVLAPFGTLMAGANSLAAPVVELGVQGAAALGATAAQVTSAAPGFATGLLSGVTGGGVPTTVLSVGAKVAGDVATSEIASGAVTAATVAAEAAQAAPAISAGASAAAATSGSPIVSAGITAFNVTRSILFGF